MAEPSNPRRRWFRFSLRGLLIGVGIASGVLGMLSYRVNCVREADSAAAALEQLGFDVLLKRNDTSEQEFFESRPYWRRVLFGEGNRHLIIRTGFSSGPDAEGFRNALAELTRFDEISSLRFWGCDDELLKELETLRNVKSFMLVDNGQTTPEGRAQLQSALPESNVEFSFILDD